MGWRRMKPQSSLQARQAGNDLAGSSIPSLVNAVATIKVVGIVAREIVKSNGCQRASPACVTSDTVQDGVVLRVVFVFVFHDFGDRVGTLCVVVRSVAEAFVIQLKIVVPDDREF